VARGQHIACGEIRNEKASLTLCLAMPKQNAEAIAKTYELSLWGHTLYYVTNLFCKNALKIAID
jgi:hypothetical protein